MPVAAVVLAYKAVESDIVPDLHVGTVQIEISDRTAGNLTTEQIGEVITRALEDLLPA